VPQVKAPFTDEHAAKLRKRGHQLETVQVRQGDHAVLVEVDGVFMFEQDAVDVAEGRVTIEEVKRRNRGQVFPLAPRD
jgi:hypothetical protein